MSYPVDPMLPKSRVQSLKALLVETPPRRCWREWLAALRPVRTLRALRHLVDGRACEAPESSEMPRKRKPKTWGGKRKGAGRPPSTEARCSCGAHTLARAIRLRLRCRNV